MIVIYNINDLNPEDQKRVKAGAEPDRHMVASHHPQFTSRVIQDKAMMVAYWNDKTETFAIWKNRYGNGTTEECGGLDLMGQILKNSGVINPKVQ